MKSVISNQIGALEMTVTGKWLITSTHESLLKTLREAARRVARQQRSILASFTFPIEWDDPLRIFTAARLAGLGECFFGSSQQSKMRSLVSVLLQPSKRMASRALLIRLLPGVPY